MIGYIPNDTFFHRLTGSSKLLCFLFISVVGMISYDTRFLLGLGILSIILFKISKIKWQDVSFIVNFMLFFSVLNLVTVYLFAPEYGGILYGSRTVILDGIGRYTLTQEQLFYEFNLLLKYICTIPLALIFLITTNPSEFAASLNRLGVSYKISYAVSLALRYIPDVQNDFRTIAQAQQARGVELSKKAKLTERVKGHIQIAIPLIFSSLERITVISNAMELRRFGKEKKRTWYSAKPMKKADFLVIGVTIFIVLIGIGLFYMNSGRFYNPFQE